MKDPVLIQGGMGVGVSGWRLARAVAAQGHLGVVSGTALDGVMVCRLQDGDRGGHMRRALEQMPVPGLGEEILSLYYRSGGKNGDEPHRHSMFKHNSELALLRLTVAANFVEVFLAKEGHSGAVGINYLEKIQLPTLPSLYGAMLAGVDYVLMGAGIPRYVPGILDKLTSHQMVSLKLSVDGATADDDFEVAFDPQSINAQFNAPLKRPKFFGIVSSSALAATLSKKSNGRVDGFVIENSTAGGHNAPPRGNLQLSDSGEPLYGPRDQVDLDEIKKLGIPFWLAGSFNTPEKLQEAIALGASGIQVGTLFAFCRESGIDDRLKIHILEKALSGDLQVFTDPLASPTGFPFKVVQLEGSLSDNDVYESRPRVCNLGYLRSAYKKADGTLGFRCPGEPVDQYVLKGGKEEDTVGRKCLCNGLVANIGFAQVQKNGYVEKALVTAGNEIKHIATLVRHGDNSYSASAVIDYLTGATSRVDYTNPPA